MIIDIEKLKNLIASGNAKKIAHYMENHNLAIANGKIICKDKHYVKEQIGYWDKRQLVKKINLNS